MSRPAIAILLPKRNQLENKANMMRWHSRKWKEPESLMILLSWWIKPGVYLLCAVCHLRSLLFKPVFHIFCRKPPNCGKYHNNPTYSSRMFFFPPLLFWFCWSHQLRITENSVSLDRTWVLSLRFSVVTLKIQTAFFCRNGKPILKFIWNFKEPRIAKTI